MITLINKTKQVVVFQMAPVARPKGEEDLPLPASAHILRWEPAGDPGDRLTFDEAQTKRLANDPNWYNKKYRPDFPNDIGNIPGLSQGNIFEQIKGTPETSNAFAGV